MASLYIVWNIKERRVESVHESNADATTARRVLSGHPKALASHFETLTATR